MVSKSRTVIRHPGSSYLIVAFVALCVTAVVHSPISTLVYLVPLALVFYVVRTATIVDDQGLRARALFGTATIGWDDLAGLRLADSGAVYAVDSSDTEVRLPCIRKSNLRPLVAAGRGRIPDPATAAALTDPATAAPTDPAQQPAVRTSPAQQSAAETGPTQ